MIATKASKYALPSMSYKARSLNIETFVISKLIHRLRHLCQRKTNQKIEPRPHQSVLVDEKTTRKLRNPPD